MIEAYKYKRINIKTLSNINSNINTFYNYKGLNFLSKLSPKNKNIVISFHGSTLLYNKTDDVIFRGYDWEIKDTDIICISDYLINIYNEVYINWTLSTKKYNTECIYIELFKYILNKKKYNHIIFTGSSAGGFPSIKFASIFNATAIVANPQLYLEKYYLFKRKIITKDTKSFSLLNIMDKYNDELIYNNKDIEMYILNNKPKLIILYQNEYDIHHYKEHYLPFKKITEDNNLENNIRLISFRINTITQRSKLFKSKNKITTPHLIRFPGNKKHLYMLQKFINDN